VSEYLHSMVDLLNYGLRVQENEIEPDQGRVAIHGTVIIDNQG
jgi:hypothetical protein